MEDISDSSGPDGPGSVGPEGDRGPNEVERTDGEADYLTMLGERVRGIRARRGITRKILARTSRISERYLAQLERGRGNISILLLRQVARAMNVPLDELVREGPERSAELALTLELLERLAPAQQKEVYRSILHQHGQPERGRDRIALVGLRGAGKSTLGRALSQALGVPFVRLVAETERLAGMNVNEIFSLSGQAGYRRLEQRALAQAIERHPRMVLEVGGSLVAEPATYNLLLGTCFTVWLRALPEDHMARVVAQGDLRPMADHREAMEDLKLILDERDAFYRKADTQVMTSGRTEADCLEELLAVVGGPADQSPEAPG